MFYYSPRSLLTPSAFGFSYFTPQPQHTLFFYMPSVNYPDLQRDTRCYGTEEFWPPNRLTFGPLLMRHLYCGPTIFSFFTALIQYTNRVLKCSVRFYANGCRFSCGCIVLYKRGINRLRIEWRIFVRGCELVISQRGAYTVHNSCHCIALYYMKLHMCT